MTTDVVLALAALSVIACLAALAFAFQARRAVDVARTLSLDLEAARAAARIAADQHFFSRFSRELPHLTQDLHGQSEARAIPVALLEILLHAFRPSQALVVLRRQVVSSDPSRGRTLTVAEVAGTQASVPRGTELRMGEGPIGLVAEAQRLMTREDFDALPRNVREGLVNGSPRGFVCDLAAPMVLNDETLGVLVLSSPSEASESAKAALRVIAHVGAMALQHATAYGEMKVSAELDGLTGLYNKTYVRTLLREKILESDANGSELSILLLDIDHFKNYNDANGHDDGDRLLEEFAQVIADNVRRSSILGRYGGEEFLLILPGIDGVGALKAAENVRRKVAAHPFAHREKQPLGVLSFSGGVATYREDAAGSNELIRAADKALYEAKRAGRNQVLRAKPLPPDEEMSPTLELERVRIV